MSKCFKDFLGAVTLKSIHYHSFQHHNAATFLSPVNNICQTSCTLQYLTGGQVEWEWTLQLQQ